MRTTGLYRFQVQISHQISDKNSGALGQFWVGIQKWRHVLNGPPFFFWLFKISPWRSSLPSHAVRMHTSNAQNILPMAFRGELAV